MHCARLLNHPFPIAREPQQQASSTQHQQHQLAPAATSTTSMAAQLLEFVHGCSEEASALLQHNLTTFGTLFPAGAGDPALHNMLRGVRGNPRAIPAIAEVDLTLQLVADGLGCGAWYGPPASRSDAVLLHEHMVRRRSARSARRFLRHRQQPADGALRGR